MSDASEPMPASIDPMRAVIGELPDDDDNWYFEIKWDGVRAIGFISEGLRLQSSNLLDITARYPELAPLANELSAHRVILDGEIVTFNADGRPDFGLLQQRMHIKDARTIAEWSARQPVLWALFDILHLDGKSTTALPYEDRRSLLGQLVEPGPNWQVPNTQHGDGAALLAAVTERRMEGIVAKRLGGVYEIGKRSTKWRKVKVRRQQEFVVGGWRSGEGTRSHTMGSILIGYHQPDGRLAYAGRVGTGFTGAELDRLRTLFTTMEIDACPYDPPLSREEARGATWLEPTLVVEVAFAEWSSDGRLRHPAYLGQRDDKDPKDVVREPG